MNSSSKTPPRFIPTLTEEVAPAVAPEAESEPASHADENGETGSALEESLSRVARVLSQPEADESDAPKARASFHSPWLADGLYVRGKAASIPHELPPLPESLPPQQPFAQSADAEPLSDQADALSGVADLSADEFDVNGVIDQENSVGEAAAEELAESESPPLPAFFESEVPSAIATANAEDQLVQRLMQRIDLVLEQRLKVAIEQVVQEQANTLALRLREELESLVRHSVHEAVESELERYPQRAEHPNGN